ncbi:MAG TPA: rhodanese-like domain-containing protein [Pyrinomonadaceae bacterium]|nr:rhodanese-like domain-containing protein [Pyrinomonadaceae bacterium]
MKAMMVLAAVALAACNSIHSNNANTHANTATTPTPAPAHATQADNVKRVTTKELETMLKDGTAIVVDVRNKAMYDAGHIRGAKLLPVTEIDKRADELPKNKMIITYCS